MDLRPDDRVLLLALPPALLAFISMTNPEYAGLLFDTSPGVKMLVGAGVLQLVGAAAILAGLLIASVGGRKATTLEAVFYEDYVMSYCPQCQTDGRVLKDRRLSRLLK